MFYLPSSIATVEWQRIVIEMTTLWTVPANRLIRVTLVKVSQVDHLLSRKTPLFRDFRWTRQLTLQHQKPGGNNIGKHLNGLGRRVFQTEQKCNVSQGAILRQQYSSTGSSWPSPVKRSSSARQKSVRVSSNGYSHFERNASPGLRSPTWRFLAFLSAGGISYYIYTSVDRAPFTKRVRLLGVSRQSENALGRQAFEELLRSFDGHVLPAQHPVTRRVRSVVARLARTVRQLDASLSEGFEWTVAVADVDEPNAMCVPGGRIVITTGLFRILQSDDDLAIILAHEIAHALNRHGVETMSLRRLIMPIVFVINQVFDLRILPSIFATLFLSLPYSRKLEYEADTVGLLLCTEACYDPRVAPGVFRRLDDLQGQYGGKAANNRFASLFSTHPHTLERANRLSRMIPEKMKKFNDKCVYSNSFERLARERSFQ